MDIRDENQIQAAVNQAVQKFGGIDILINNASAIWPRSTEDTPMKRYDLMMQVNIRGTFATSQACLPFLKKKCFSRKKSTHSHIITSFEYETTLVQESLCLYYQQVWNEHVCAWNGS